MKNFKLRIYKFFNIKYCHKCLGTTVETSSMWSRAWDSIYGGAFGDRGHRCFDCGYIEWDRSVEEYNEDLNPNGGTQWKIYQDSPRYKNGNLIE